MRPLWKCSSILELVGTITNDSTSSENITGQYILKYSRECIQLKYEYYNIVF